jgi:hypothetical protein
VLTATGRPPYGFQEVRQKTWLLRRVSSSGTLCWILLRRPARFVMRLRQDYPRMDTAAFIAAAHRDVLSRQRYLLRKPNRLDNLSEPRDKIGIGVISKR